MLYNQPLAVRFGTEVLRQVDEKEQGRVDPFWDTLDIAVAWVRASGMAYLSEGLAQFLQLGGQLSIIVGVDLRNTTREGLQGLLDLEVFGHSETYVYHNEAGSIFHPKLYLFRNEEEARLIVGSNNITASGLYVNVEAGLQVDSDVNAPVIGQAVDAIASWKDPASGLVVRLDPAVLDRLVREGYVPDEAEARAASAREKAARPARTTAPLFGSRPFTPPVPAPARGKAPPPRSATGGTLASAPAAPELAAEPTGAPGSVLLMRLRKAHAIDRPTQTQIPMRVVATAFFSGIGAVRSTHSGVTHGIIQASARGGPNTIKLEIPEMRYFADPMARLQKTPEGMEYEVYDLGSPQGNAIKASLDEGRTNGTTQLAINDPASATWWRFI